ncbi:RNA pyrophosphohydrolase [uncultured Alsobacter sp.]|uniref:RNA pyrophosphohydrolase n=1 Tax=uncultured Alsobacter sp. TaxID=1748258 RepID=UPI0025FAC8FE|nr:RNA pyrophosphohydrolase [uncultured Alsobacter sp.]
MTLPYRPNVGIALFNAEGLVFAGRSHAAGPERIEPGFEWQMPQGGIEPDEEIVAAARRELAEETRVTSVSLLAATDEWWAYDFPPYDGPPHKLSAFRGQRQRWVAFRFEGPDSEIDVLDPGGPEIPEFSEWGWFRLSALPTMVVPFKREVYARVVTAFAAHAAP